jgi:hypothetical protein
MPCLFVNPPKDQSFRIEFLEKYLWRRTDPKKIEQS